MKETFIQESVNTAADSLTIYHTSVSLHFLLT